MLEKGCFEKYQKEYLYLSKLQNEPLFKGLDSGNLFKVYEHDPDFKHIFQSRRMSLPT